MNKEASDPEEEKKNPLIIMDVSIPPHIVARHTLFPGAYLRLGQWLDGFVSEHKASFVREHWTSSFAALYPKVPQVPNIPWSDHFKWTYVALNPTTPNQARNPLRQQQRFEARAQQRAAKQRQNKR
jgi:hypothetical protein